MHQRRIWLGPLFVLIGGTIALVGTYWDDAWHTDRGRDTFFAPPHLVLYSGVALTGIAVALWALQVVRTPGRIRVLMHHPPLLLAAFGTAATILSAPIDDAWHRLFGRDAVLWSPPHLLGVVALLCVGVGTLLELGRNHTADARRTLWAAALVVGTVMVPVMEYETDVPQFALVWYFPVLSGCMTLAFLLIERISAGHIRITAAVALYTGLRISIAGFLLLLDHATTIIPPILVPALVFDWSARRSMGTPLRAVLLAGSIVLSYGLYLPLVPGGLTFTPWDFVIGLAGALGASWLMSMLVVLPDGKASVRALTLGSGIIVLMTTPASALAHDPGQGDPIGQVTMTVLGANDGIQVTAFLMEHTHDACADILPRAVVGRRAGVTVRMPLRRQSGCDFAGTLQLDDPGRWFVYVEWEHGSDLLESWVPVQIGSASPALRSVREVYRPSLQSGSRGQRGAAIGLYSIIVLILGGILWICRRQPSPVVSHGDDNDG